MGEPRPSDQSIESFSAKPPLFEGVPSHLEYGKEASLRVLADVESWLESNGNYDSFERLDLNYDELPPKALDGQVAVTVMLIQPVAGTASFGELNPGTKLVLTTQQVGRYAEGKRAFPMGKIDLERDLADTTYDRDEMEGLDPEMRERFVREVLGSASRRTIINAAGRERREEISTTPAQSETVLAGTSLDKTTGTTVHVVIENVIATTGDNSSDFEVGISPAQQREHAGISLVPIERLDEAGEIDDGVMFSILTAVRSIKKQNKR